MVTMRWILQSAILGIALMACGSSKQAEDDKTKEPPVTAVAGDTESPNATPPSPVEPATPQPSAPAADKPAAGKPTIRKQPEKRAPEKLDKAQAAAIAAYKQALGNGRKLSDKRRYAEAIPHFQKALKHRPDDAASNSELGWAALKINDLELAKTATEAALRQPQKNNLRAASLYNLGRIHEAAGDRKRAVEAYSRSLSLRPHQTVEKRLKTLQGDTGTGAGRTISWPLIGPHKSMAGICGYFEQLVRSEEYGPVSADEEFECSIEDASSEGSKPLMLTQSAGAIRSAQVVSYGGEYESRCELVIQVKSGWYTTRGFLTCYGDAEGGGVSELAFIEGGGAAVLFVPSVYWSSLKDSFVDEEGEEWRYTWTMYDSMVTFCAVDAQGRPLCTSTLGVRSWTDSEMDDEGNDLSPEDQGDHLDRVSARLDDTGTLTIVGIEHPYEKDAKMFLGPHELVFHAPKQTE